MESREEYYLPEFLPCPEASIGGSWQVLTLQIKVMGTQGVKEGFLTVAPLEPGGRFQMPLRILVTLFLSVPLWL